MKLAVLTIIAAFALLAIGGVSARSAHAGGPQSGTIVLDQASPSLGDYVTFTTTTSGLNGSQHPRIEIDCYQDVPFDYTDSNGVTHTQTDPLVFASAAPADQAQQLGGAASVWLWHGGSAHCTATLYYWDNHPSQTFVPLASVNFTAGG
jgi:hypothetical protein